jgi:hypothetical protein
MSRLKIEFDRLNWDKMKKTKFTESQIIGILKEQEQGKKADDICREPASTSSRASKSLRLKFSNTRRLSLNKRLIFGILKDLNSKKF